MTPEEALIAKGIEIISRSGSEMRIHCLLESHEDNDASCNVNDNGVYNCLSCPDPENKFGGQDIVKTLGFGESEKVLRNITTDEVFDMLLGSREYKLPEDAEPFAKENFRGISLDTYLHYEAFTSDIADRQCKVGPDFMDRERIWFPLKKEGMTYGIIGRFIYESRHPDHKRRKYHILRKGAETKDMFPDNEVLGEVVLVEGLMDVMNLYDKGVTNAYALLGLKNNKMNLKGLEASKIYLMLDSDEHGVKYQKYISTGFFNRYIEVIPIEIPEKDPGDLSLEQIEEIKNEFRW